MLRIDGVVSKKKYQPIIAPTIAWVVETGNPALVIAI
jgi:hypothetical protein